MGAGEMSVWEVLRRAAASEAARVFPTKSKADLCGLGRQPDRDEWMYFCERYVSEINRAMRLKEDVPVTPPPADLESAATPREERTPEEQALVDELCWAIGVNGCPDMIARLTEVDSWIAIYTACPDGHGWGKYPAAMWEAFRKTLWDARLELMRRYLADADREEFARLNRQYTGKGDGV